MLITAIKFLFCFCAVMYICMTIYGKFFVFRKKKPQFVSDYCATMGVFIAAYSISAILLALILPTTLGKILMLFFAAFPFGLGLITTYYTEKYYTVLQIIVLALSVLYIW